MSKPLVSVIIPCYNVSNHVQKAIQSIVVQTYSHLEIWVIDDASTDDTLEKVNRFTDKRIHVIGYKENTQKIGAVNDVLREVKGDYICFQDADDWSEPTRIEKQIKEFLRDDQLGICLTGFCYAGDKKGLPGKITLSDKELKDGFLNFRHSNDQLELPACPSMMISRGALQKTSGYHPYFRGRVAEDIHWIYRILKNFKGVVVDEALYHYWVRNESLTGIQHSGLNAKAAYSWPLLAKIIHLDIHKKVDALAPDNKELLQKIELEACEEALVNSIQTLNTTIHTYKNSRSYKLGQFLLNPIKLIFKKKTAS